MEDELHEEWDKLYKLMRRKIERQNLGWDMPIDVQMAAQIVAGISMILERVDRIEKALSNAPKKT